MDEAKEQGYEEGYEEGFGMARSFREIRTRKRSARDRGVPVPAIPPTHGRYVFQLYVVQHMRFPFQDRKVKSVCSYNGRL